MGTAQESLQFKRYHYIDDPKWIKRFFDLEQIRAARGLLGWSQSELANRAGLSLPTVKRVEAGVGPRVSDAARARIQEALEIGGVRFIDENGGGQVSGCESKDVKRPTREFT